MAWSTKALMTSVLSLCLLLSAEDAHSQPPTVTNVYVPLPSNGYAFELAEAVYVIVDFDRAVVVTGVPLFALTIDTQTRHAAFVDTPAGPDTSVYFRYAVAPSDYDANGLGIAADALTPGTGTITALDGTAALLDLGSHAKSAYAFRQVDGRRQTTPAVGGVTISPPPFGDTFELAETISVSVWFNRALTVTGAPRLALTIGSLPRYASFFDAPAPSRIAPEAPAFAPWPVRFLYAVESSDSDEDGISIDANALTAGVGTIKIRGGTVNAALDLGDHAIRNSAGHKVDGERPGGRIGGNRAPQVVDELPDLEIDVGETVAVNAAVAFEDADGDSLRYSASSNDIVALDVSGSTVRVRGVRPGRATVLVSATDPHGLKATATFRVAVGALLWPQGGRPAAPEGGTVVLELELSKPLTVPISTRWHLGPDSDAATADANAADYLVAPAGVVSIPAGETSATIEIPIADDADIEPAREHFVVHLEPLAEENVALARTAGTQALIQEGVCDRTPAIRDELSRHRVGCHWVGPAALAAVLTLDLSRRNIDALHPNDMLGLRGLRHLDLSANALEALPAGLFTGLNGLQEVSVAGNPGAPFALTIEMARLDAQPWEPGPAQVAARTAWGAPFTLAAALSAFPADATTGALPATADIAAGATMGPSFSVPTNDGAALVLQAAAPPLPKAQCRGQPCFRGFQTVPGPALVLFRQAPRALTAPTPGPLQAGDALRLPLASLVDAPVPVTELHWEATSSDDTLATVRIFNGTLEVTPELASAGTADIVLVATDDAGLSTTLRFKVRVEFHWPPGRGWRSTLTRTQQPDGN